MKRILIGFFALIAGFGVQAQLVNDGATIVVKPGATLFVESNVTNNTGGTITVEGTLEVQGDLTNNATMTTAAGSLVKFSGTGDSNLKSNGATIVNLELAKTGAANTLTLTDNGNVTTNLNFTASGGGRIVLGAANLIMASAATITGADANEYVVTNSSGALQKNYANGALSSSVFKFEVGDATNYSPLTASVTGTASSASLQGSVVNADQPNRASSLAESSDYLTRYWNVDQTGITSYSNSVTGQYVTADDVVGTQAKIKGSSYSSPNWSFIGAANNVGTPSVSGTITASSADFTGTNFFGKVNLTAYLAGALPSGTVMTTNLPTLGAGFPLTTPYNVAPFNAPTVTAPSVPANTVDWILVEARDAAVPATVLSQKSAFILNTGLIVNPDGSALTIKDANSTSIIALRHRNHLAIRTNVGLDLAASPTTTHNFTTGIAQAYTDGTISNANMRAIGSVFAMWGGNANQAVSPPQAGTEILYNGSGSDRTTILSAVGGTANANTPITGVYSASDVNLDKDIVYNGSGSDRVYILSTVGGTANANNPIKAHQ